MTLKTPAYFALLLAALFVGDRQPTARQTRRADFAAAKLGLSLSSLVSARCHPVPRQRWPAGDYVYFIGRASGRTIRAGAPHPFEGVAGALSRAEAERRVPGQVVSVERIARNRPVRLPLKSREIVVVQWGWGATCEATRHDYRKVETGRREFWHGVLRPRELWANNIPTVDMYAEFDPQMSVARADSVFPILDSLPSDSAINANPSAALGAVQLWRARSSFTHRFAVAGQLIANIDAVLARELRTRVAGTYRVRLAVDSSTRVGVSIGEDTTRFDRHERDVFIRIADVPLRHWSYDTASAWWEERLTPFGNVRHHEADGPVLILRAVAGDSVTHLFGETRVPRFDYLEGRVGVSTRAIDAGGGVKLWRARLHVVVFNPVELARLRNEPRSASRLGLMAPIFFFSEQRPFILPPVPRTSFDLNVVQLEFEERPDGSVRILPAPASRQQSSGTGADLRVVGIRGGERISTKSFVVPDQTGG